MRAVIVVAVLVSKVEVGGAMSGVSGEQWSAAPAPACMGKESRLHVRGGGDQDVGHGHTDAQAQHASSAAKHRDSGMASLQTLLTTPCSTVILCVHIVGERHSMRSIYHR